jgi:uncharacterized protein YciI
MTTWINAGASVNGQRVKTKAELKRLLKSEPQNVAFDTTGEFPYGEWVQTASDLGNRPNHKDEAWQIVGPDPYTNRKWYATVTVNNLKNLVVK